MVATHEPDVRVKSQRKDGTLLRLLKSAGRLLRKLGRSIKNGLPLAPHDDEEDAPPDWNIDAAPSVRTSHVLVVSKGIGADGAVRINAQEEYFYCTGVLHRQEGPALVTRSVVYGTTEGYYRHGQLHREDGPALVKDTAFSREEQYYRNGKLDRKDGPAVIRRSADGTIEEEYWRNGKLYRKDGPQIIIRHGGGSTEERYCENGVEDRPDRLHRADGPALILRNPWDGSTKEEYYQDGVPRSIASGPAFITHNADGSMVKEYCRFGQIVKTERVASAAVPANSIPNTDATLNAQPRAQNGSYAELAKTTPRSTAPDAKYTTRKSLTPGMTR